MLAHMQASSRLLIRRKDDGYDELGFFLLITKVGLGMRSLTTMVGLDDYFTAQAVWAGFSDANIDHFP